MHSSDGFSGAVVVAAQGRGAGGSKVDQAYLALKQAIVSGALAPDTPIDKNEWCAIFEVSRLSITTAINRPAFERLVVVEPQRGSYVAKIRLEDVRQCMLMRRALEMEVVALCAADMPDRAIEGLSQNLAYQRAAITSGDLQGFHELTRSAPILKGCAELFFPSRGARRELSASMKRSIRRLRRAGRIKLETKWPTISIGCRESCIPLSPGIPVSLRNRTSHEEAHTLALTGRCTLLINLNDGPARLEHDGKKDVHHGFAVSISAAARRPIPERFSGVRRDSERTSPGQDPKWPSQGLSMTSFVFKRLSQTAARAHNLWIKMPLGG